MGWSIVKTTEGRKIIRDEAEVENRIRLGETFFSIHSVLNALANY